MDTACLVDDIASFAALGNMFPATYGAACDKTLGDWAQIRFDTHGVSEWSPRQAEAGLVALEQIRRSLAAVTASLVNRLDAGRDTAAAVTRATGASGSQAREMAAVAKVVSEQPDASEMLSNGVVSAGHIRPLAYLKPAMAAELLPQARGLTVDEFARLVASHRVKSESNSLAQEQHAERSVTFFQKPNGCIGATIVLPPTEGLEFRNTLNDLCDQAWRAAHPDRAETLGGHEAEPRNRRLADAFVAWMRSKIVATGKPALIVHVEAETLTATIAPDTPIPIDKALEVMARADLYAAIRDGTNRATMQFGRNRRYASPLQKLALMLLQPRCIYPGCDTPAQRSDAHHLREHERGGPTNLENEGFLCGPHHAHVHLHNITLIELDDGTWTIAPCTN
jgi:hypothetical protein